MSKEQAREFFEAAAKDEASDADLSAVSGGFAIRDRESLHRARSSYPIRDRTMEDVAREPASLGQSVAQTELTSTLLRGLEDFDF